MNDINVISINKTSTIAKLSLNFETSLIIARNYQAIKKELIPAFRELGDVIDLKIRFADLTVTTKKSRVFIKTPDRHYFSGMKVDAVFVDDTHLIDTEDMEYIYAKFMGRVDSFFVAPSYTFENDWSKK